MDTFDTGLLMVRRGMKVAFFLLFLSALLTAAPVEPLAHVGIICLEEEPLAAQFAGRLAARGTPLFYISDISRGVAQGDIIRFKDKALIIDADIWQTMMSMGILTKLKDIPVMTLTAKAHSDVWASRSDRVSKSIENKGYTLGRELLKIFEDYFGKNPSRMVLAVKFNGEYMTLSAPRQLMAELQFSEVVRLKKNTEKPFFVTEKPPSGYFVGDTYSFAIWAVDVTDGGSQLTYSISGIVPPGLRFETSAHAISGTIQSAGSWPLVFSVRNSRGQSAMLPCTLSFSENTPPRVHMKWDEPLSAGSKWVYQPFFSDREHLRSELIVNATASPKGMRFLDSSDCLEWDVPMVTRDTAVAVSMQAIDPVGAIGRSRLLLKIKAVDTRAPKITIDVHLPVDTMIQGHRYSWPDRVWVQSVWKERAVSLVSIAGSDSTQYFPFDGEHEGSLVVCPMTTPEHELTFTFKYDTATIIVKKTVAIRPNATPVFKSALSTYEVDRGAVLEYRPVAVDADGDSLLYKVYGKSPGFDTIPNGSLLLPTGVSGLHTRQIVASDKFGNSATQQIYYTVLVAREQKSAPFAFYVQNSCRNSSEIGLRTGGLRIGFFAPDIVKTVTTGLIGINTIESPFFFFGATPLSEKQTALGNYLFFDGGISGRMYNNRLFGGGILGRVQSDYRHKGTSPWRFQALFSAHLKQALFIADTTGLRNELNYYLLDKATGAQTAQAKYAQGLMDVLNAYGSPNNVGLYFRIQTMYRFPAGFWLGPSMWIEDELWQPQGKALGLAPLQTQNSSDTLHVPGNMVAQYTGFALAHDLSLKNVTLSQQLTIGWKGNTMVPTGQWNFIMSWNKRKKNS